MPQEHLQHCHQGHGDHHAHHAEELSADEDPRDDSDGVHIDDAAHQFRHEEMTVQLLHNDVENNDLHHDTAALQEP